MNPKVTAALLFLFAAVSVGAASYLYFELNTNSAGVNNSPVVHQVSEPNNQLSVFNEVTSTDENGVHTYTNHNFGISLKYPSDWSLTSGASENNGGIDLEKNGYRLTIQACTSSQSCYKKNYPLQTYQLNTLLSPPIGISFNIDGQQAWRNADPEGEKDTPPYLFNFAFLRSVSSSPYSDAFNNTHTPVSDQMVRSGIIYRINYSLPLPVPEPDYDHSIVGEMDDIVNSIKFIN